MKERSNATELGVMRYQSQKVRTVACLLFVTVGYLVYRTLFIVLSEAYFSVMIKKKEKEKKFDAKVYGHFGSKN